MSVSDGLSNPNVQSLLQDDLGFIWIGTQDGLNRYDGYDFLTFRTQRSDATSLSNNLIWVLEKGENGELWVGTDRGLNLYHPKTQSFTRYFHERGNPDSLGSNLVRALCYDSKGRLWVGTEGGGISLLEQGSTSFIQYRQKKDDPTSLPGNHIWVIYEDSQGRILVGSTEGGLAVYDESSDSFIRVLDVPFGSRGNQLNGILDIIETGENRFWLGTFGSGLWSIDLETKTLSRPSFEGSEGPSVEGTVSVFVGDKNGKTWIGTFDGIYAYDGKTNQLSYYEHSEKDPTSLSSNQIWSLLIDQRSNLWAGTFVGGLDFYHAQTTGFETIRSIENDPSSIVNNMVWAFEEDAQGNIYVGTNEGGLSIAGSDLRSFETITELPVAKESQSNTSVLGLYEDSKGLLWIGTWAAGLFSLDTKTREIKAYWDPGAEPGASVNNPYVWRILEDSEGYIWIGTMGGGLNRYDPKTNSFSYYLYDENDPNTIPNNSIWSLFEDSRGRLWVGTHDGVCLLDKTTMKFTRFMSVWNDPESLSGEWVVAMTEDRLGRMWFGTYGGGLNLYHEPTGTFSSFGVADGLPNAVINSMLMDDSGRMWVSTNRGIASVYYSRSRGLMDIVTYDSSHGLQSDQFNMNAGFALNDGRLLFGGSHGFNVFHPRDLVSNQHIPKVHITSMHVSSRDKSGDDSMEERVAGVFDNSTLEFPHNKNNFSFDFVCLSYISPEKNQYRYMLEGFDQRWNYVSSARRFARYTNIPPGDYSFKVIASNNDGLWNMEGASVRFSIAAPWYQAWWAYCLYALALLWTIALSVMIGTKVLRQQTIELEKKVNERTEEIKKQSTLIARQNTELSEKNQSLNEVNEEMNFLVRAVAQDLRDPLSRVKCIIDLLVAESNQIERSYVEILEESIDQQLAIVSKILGLRTLETIPLNVKFESVNMAKTIQKIGSVFSQEAAKKRIKLFIDKPKEKVRAIADPELLRNVMENLVSNAIKYSPFGGVVRISWALNQTGSSVTVEVQDNGPGIPQAEMGMLFHKFQTISTMPTAGEDSDGLGLSLVKQYIESMNGSVWCESVLGEGSTFCFSLKVTTK